MRPPILSKSPIEQIISDLKDSKEKERWVVRFIPQILNKDKLNANAISLMKRVSLLKLEPITDEELEKLKKYLIEQKREDLVVIRQKENRQKDVLIFCQNDDAPETIDGVERHIFRVIPNAKLKFGASDINRDRCCIVKRKTWKTEKDRPTGVYAAADLTVSE
jgi:tetrahydrodipicolinate N-succinyltransferase